MDAVLKTYHYTGRRSTPVVICYAHGDVAIRNIIRRNEHFYLIDYGLAIMLQLQFDPFQVLIQDYIELCQIIGIVKFGKKLSLLELTNRLNRELKQFVIFVEDANGLEIADEVKWLEKFNAKARQFHEKDYHRFY
ncbi:kinase-like domain-containing protein [Gigaspora margarita]|uniref:Kinase-like domain-containing protein n=1 Tax=Gigaspora margarita TaxID=4874 RepID=A0A8H4A281_GIGMA|nr:kinase-like domain-containing protein [Gigaspora margarita]